jgi:hypothetical protein
MIIYKVTTSICCGSGCSKGPRRPRASAQLSTTVQQHDGQSEAAGLALTSAGAAPNSARFCGVAWPRETVAAGSARALRAPPTAVSTRSKADASPIARMASHSCGRRASSEQLLQRVPRQLCLRGCGSCATARMVNAARLASAKCLLLRPTPIPSELAAAPSGRGCRSCTSRTWYSAKRGCGRGREAEGRCAGQSGGSTYSACALGLGCHLL